MAKKVNTRFVIGLAVAITALAAGVGFVGWKAITKSGDDYIKLGDARTAEGDYEEAAKMYARAVNHEQTNVAWIEKWDDALRQTTPESVTVYLDRYKQHQDILRSLAAIEITNPKRYEDSLQETYRQTEALPGTASWQQIEFASDSAIETLGGADAPAAQTLRRYRGFAGLALMDALDRSQVKRDQALADLKAAYAADATDVESGVGVFRYYIAQWRMHLRQRHAELAKRAWKTSRDIMKDLLAVHGEDPRVLYQDIRAKLQYATSVPTTPAERQTAVKALATEEKPLVDLLLSLPPEQIPSEVADRSVVLHSQIRGSEAEAINHQIVDRLLAARPNDDRLLLAKGVMFAGETKLDEAYATFQKVADAPTPTISLEGALLIERRPRALMYMAETALAKWSTLSDGEEKDNAWRQAKDARARLVALMPGGESAPPVLQVDGKIAYAQQKFAVASQKFMQLDGLTSSHDPEILRILIQSLMRQDQIGAAREKLAQLIELAPANVSAMLQAADIDLQLRNVESAQKLLERVLALDPENEKANRQYAAIQASTKGAQTDDPVVNALVEVTQMRNQPDVGVPELIAKTQEIASKFPDDIRPRLVLIRFAAEQGDMPAIARFVDDALQRFPSDTRLQEIKARLTTQDPLAFAIQETEKSGASPASKEVRKYMIYTQFQKPDEAAQALQRAIALDPDDAAVIEAQFLSAMSDGRIEDARALAARAANLNLDGVDGLLYEARIELREGRNDAAVGVIQQAIERAPLSAIAHRLLGQALFQTGRVAEAVDAFARAVEYRPNDTTAVRAYMQALMQVGRSREALDVARKTISLTRLDRQLNEQWLLLEELVGNADVAIRERQGMLQRNAKDRNNIFALIRLLLAKEQWDEADRLIKFAVADGGVDLPLALLEARAKALRGDVTGGAAIIHAFIDTMPENQRTAAPYLALGEFLIAFDDEAAGLEAYTEAAKHQSPERMEADRRLGDYLFDQGRYAQAVEPYKRVIDAGADSAGLEVAMRLAETLLRLERWDDAGATLTKLGDAGATNFRILLLRAQASSGKGDTNKARQLLDAAVEAAPNNAIPFLRRALFNASDSTQFNDVMADLEQALALDPASVAARQVRAALFLQRGRIEDAIAEYAAGVEANPESEELRVALIKQYTSAGRTDEAETAAEAAVSADPENSRWRVVAGDVYADDGKWDKALEHFQAAFQRDKSVDVAARLAAALLSQDSPSADEVMSVLEEEGSTAQEDGRLLVLRAWALHALGKPDEAKQTVVRALASAQTSADLREWFRRLPNIIDSGDLVSFISAQTPPEAVKPLYTALRAQLLLGDASKRSALQRDLEAAVQSAQDPLSVTEVNRALGMIHYFEGRYADAAEAFARGAAVATNDADLNNNLAYIRVKYLNDPKGALAPAERAVELSPTNGGVLDTLGWVYHQLGREQQARAILNKALQYARTDEERTPALLHLAEALVSGGEAAAARRRADEAADILRKSPSLNQEYEKDLQSLMERLNQADISQ